MGKILQALLGWFGGKLATLALILAVLIGGAWLTGELKRADQLSAERAQASATKTQLEAARTAVIGQAAGKLELAKQELAKLEAAINERQARISQLRRQHPLMSRLPFSKFGRQAALLQLQIDSMQAMARQLATSQQLSQQQLAQAQRQFQIAIDQWELRARQLGEEAAQGLVSRVMRRVRSEIQLALAILAAVILVPIVLKLFRYFIVAPWAAGRPPIRLLPATSGDITPVSAPEPVTDGSRKASAVSQSIVLPDHQELLIKPQYLQSTSRLAPKRTRWLLDASIPLTSLLSGMFMLTRVGPAGPEPVVISATQDALSEVGILTVPAGAALICQPRSLVGVVQDLNQPMRITRHWRLDSLQAWLTLQLRFLAFHGPVQLVLQGCRGIRVERAGAGRLVNQAATLGFSANVAYGNTRCETFVSYWTGKEDLFNDIFEGPNGVYVYEEMPDLKRHAGITGRGPQGVLDAGLKVFGI